jgi:hypothetical protein
VRPPRRVGPTLLTGSSVVLDVVTQPSRLGYIRLTNPTAASIAATVALVPRGATLAPVHHILSEQVIPPHDVFGWTGEIPAGAGDALVGSGSGLVLQATIQEEH